MIAKLLRKVEIMLGLLFYYMGFALDLCARTKKVCIQLAIRKIEVVLLLLGLNI